jgi:hypothetical protein
MKKRLLENAKIHSRYYHHCVQRQLPNSFPGLVCGGPMEMAKWIVWIFLAFAGTTAQHSQY